MKVEKNKNLKKLTTFRVGGKADFFVEVENINELLKAIDFAKTKKIPYVVIGNSSNILINDKGFRGLVIKLTNNRIEKTGTNKMKCWAGTDLSYLVTKSINMELSGTEFLAGIPGTIGGALISNAGMGGKQVSDIINKITLIKNGKEIIKANKDYYNFSYRSSSIKPQNEIITEVEFNLKKSNKEKILKNIKTYTKSRINQPSGFSAGSIFKNPKEDFAGRLIEKTKLKGKIRGDAIISPKHGNFIINKGKASSSDIKWLIKNMQQKVLNKYGVHLKREIKYLNERRWA